MSAHGTGTPQNRTTESHIFSELAGAFGIEKWPITAVKSYVGHSIACASGDQLASIIGTWADGIIPGIKTIDQVAPDVFTDNLEFLLEHRAILPEAMDAAFINSKGFGGNNATAAILSPKITKVMLEKKHGKASMIKHAELNECVRQASLDYDDSMLAGENSVIYKYGDGVIEGNQLKLSKSNIMIPGQKHSISLNIPNPYSVMID